MSVVAFDDSNIGKYQLATALGQAAASIPFLPGGGTALMLGLGAVAVPAAAAGVGILGAGAALTAGLGYAAYKSGAVPWLAGKVIGNTLKATQVIGGGVVGTATKTAGWIYEHPRLTLGVAAGAGLGIGVMSSWMSPNRPHGVPTQESMTEIYGGTSNYGVSSIMSRMNATGDIVFGMQARR